MTELRAKPHLLDNGTLFTEAERRHCRSRPDPAASLAGLFSAKEAFVKAVGALPRAPAHTFPDIEIAHGPTGRPRIRLHGRIGRWFEEGNISADVSISHSGDMAGAVVVLLAAPAPSEGEQP
ncbi:holo-ACP synthase [Streptomyces sp. NPDC015220]|uniref:holo-ACP synthase n=1 Tax=Streptomyces sp. NPDC015220 TaxID=3364947 RepID=UPI00370238A1